MVFFHEESRSLVNGGHGWWYRGDTVALPWLARKLLGLVQGEVAASRLHYAVFDGARCAESARRILAWDFGDLIDLHAPLNERLTGGAHAAVERLCRPLIEGRWQDLPYKRGTLQIPEGTATGGDWKSYRS